MSNWLLSIFERKQKESKRIFKAHRSDMDVNYEKLLDIFWKLVFSFSNDYKYKYTNTCEILSHSLLRSKKFESIFCSFLFAN